MGESEEGHLGCTESLGFIPSTTHSNQEIQTLPEEELVRLTRTHLPTSSQGFLQRNQDQQSTMFVLSIMRWPPVLELSGSISRHISRGTDVGKPSLGTGPHCPSRKSEGRRRMLTDGLVVERPEIVGLQSTAAKQP